MRKQGYRSPPRRLSLAASDQRINRAHDPAIEQFTATVHIVELELRQEIIHVDDRKNNSFFRRGQECQANRVSEEKEKYKEASCKQLNENSNPPSWRFLPHFELQEISAQIDRPSTNNLPIVLLNMDVYVFSFDKSFLSMYPQQSRTDNFHGLYCAHYFLRNRQQEVDETAFLQTSRR